MRFVASLVLAICSDVVSVQARVRLCVIRGKCRRQSDPPKTTKTNSQTATFIQENLPVKAMGKSGHHKAAWCPDLAHLASLGIMDFANAHPAGFGVVLSCSTGN